MHPSWIPAFPWNWNLFLHELCTFGVCFSSFLRLLAIIIPRFCGSGQLYGGKIIPKNGFHLSQMKKKKNPVIRFIIKWSSFWVYNGPPGQCGQPQMCRHSQGRRLAFPCALLKSLQTTRPDSVATAAAARPQLQLFNGLRCLAGFQAWGPKDKPDEKLSFYGIWNHETGPVLGCKIILGRGERGFRKAFHFLHIALVFLFW